MSVSIVTVAVVSFLVGWFGRSVLAWRRRSQVSPVVMPNRCPWCNSRTCSCFYQGALHVASFGKTMSAADLGLLASRKRRPRRVETRPS